MSHRIASHEALVQRNRQRFSRNGIRPYDGPIQ